MLRDVFYFNQKPNVHPREKFATSLEDARSQCTTEHFWIINEYCDYRNFDWDFDFEFLPDEDVWAEEHNNVWPSQHQKDSGTWLCPAELSEIIIYRADVDTVRRKNETHENWILLDLVDKTKFDFSWHPDPTDPPYIYSWGCKYFPVELQSCLEYHVPGATTVKYMNIIVELLPQPDRWVEVQEIDKSLFDMTWRPNPLDPPMNYVWGNKYIDGKLKSTLEYHMPGATDTKYMSYPIAVLPELDRWVEVQAVDKTKFDMSWRPDPREPAYIYVWGNKYEPAEILHTLEYHCNGATEIKYMNEPVDVMPQWDRWQIHVDIDKNSFDFSWRPDPREPAYIYQWGNKHYSSELSPTISYIVPSATEVKHMSQDVELTVNNNWVFYQEIDKTKFDLTWRPDPTSPPYIYTWGNKHIQAELKPTLEYHVPGATEHKYMSELVEVLPEFNRWKEIQSIDRTKFDLTWRPDPREPAYIYVWGNKHIPGELKSTIEYHCDGAIEYKYMDELVEVLPEFNRWKEIQSIDRTKFDLTWRPDPREPAYIYTWGNKHIPGELKSTIEYHCDGAIEYKYMDELVEVLPEQEYWKVTQEVKNFDFTWRPDPREPAYIYTWGNKHIAAELKPTVEYYCKGATEQKYMGDVEVLPELDKWKVTQQVMNFDFTWRPNPTSPPYIYVWGNKYIPAELKPTLEYVVPGATEFNYMPELVEVSPELDRWKEIQLIDKTKFDLSWRPDPREPDYIYVWGNKYINAEIKATLEYHVDGATQRKYIGEVEVLPEFDRWKEIQPIDKTKFDFTWRPDPREPAYIYTWGNKYIGAEIKPTLEYHYPNATERKYMGDVEVLPEFDKWNIVQEVENFDFSWRPDPREPDYIYVWGNKHIPGELKPTLEYHCTGATERKYVGEVDVSPEWDRYQILIPVDKTSFDFTWRPDPREPAFIYVWGNQSNSAEKEPTIEYHCEGATERKYMNDKVAKTLPVIENWKILIPVDNFDFSWRPDPDSPPYIYVFGNQWHDAMTEPTLEYHVEDATEKKYVTEIVPNVTKTQEYWKTLIPIESFDYSWRPNPHSTPYIYVFGNQWHDSITEPTIEYHCPGATDKKYITDVVALAKSTATDNHWKRLIPIESFDYSWRPDPNSPPYIYVFGNKWNDAATEPSVEYYVDGATEHKYVSDPVAIPKAEIQYWAINNNDDLETFDFTWRPNPHSPSQIYQWQDNGPRYTVPGATDVVLMEHTGKTKKAIVNRYKIKTTLEELINEHPEEVFWAINPDLKYDKFDFGWRPNEENFRHINVFGNEHSKDTQTYYINGPLYILGNKEYNYVEDQSVQVDSNLSMFFIDKSNKESTSRFNELKLRYPQLQKTRYLNSWADTINRCITKAETKLFWVLNSELDYSEFNFDFYPSPWQMNMIHVFGTQWSHWGNTYVINKETFAEDTKYVKVIEHLSNLNFVKQRKAKATNVLYEIVYIDHGNKDLSDINNLIIKYEKSYLNTFRNMLDKLTVKKEHYVWVASTICDYTNFDFTYICDPFAKEQLHVFPSAKQKFGDTFLIDVNKLRELIDGMSALEDYNKINFNQSQRLTRLEAPVIITETDTHVASINAEFDFPYAVFTTSDNKDIKVLDNEPMNMWSYKTKNIIITSEGGTRIIVPKEAPKYIKKELYDYPYIMSNDRLAKSNSLDIVFFSNGEACAEANYEHLLKLTEKLPNKVVRIDGINGRVKSQHTAAESSATPWYFLVNAKLKVDSKFDFSWQPDRLQIPKHYIFHATNPVNGLIYGHQAIVANNKKLTLENFGTGLDFTMDSEHEVVAINSGIGMYNSSEWDTWRTSFRECIKLKTARTLENKERLDTWLNIGTGEFAQYSIQGAKDAVEYYNEVNGDFEKLRFSYDWAWLRTFYETKYK